MRDNLSDAIPKIVDCLDLNLNPNTSRDGKMVNILLNISKLFTGSKAKVEHDKILKVFPVSILIISTLKYACAVN